MAPDKYNQAILYLNYLKTIGMEEIILRTDKISLYKDLIRKINECKDCELYKGRLNAVPGSGSIFSKLMVIGEAPGEKEDNVGLPFVGPSGQKLTLWLKEIGIQREDIYITNVVKCRPPHNREPTIEEVSKCRKFLDFQVEFIKPTIILLLGNIALEYFTGERKGIMKRRGIVFSYKNILVLPTYHPSFILSNPDREEEVKTDFKKLKELYYEH